ncbi:MAG: YveK family protein [Acutalibacteraceae bacterium]
MNGQTKASDDYNVIDLLHIAKALWQRAWIIVISALVAAVVGFSVSAFTIAPKYSSQIMLYVNNSSVSLGTTSFRISASDLSASQSLVKTYGVILNNRTTLEAIIDKSGVPYSYSQLSSMIYTSSVNDTEVMSVSVTSTDPYEAAKIANCIAEVLPARISEIIEGCSMEVIDSAVPNTNKISPNITKYTAQGFILGFIIAAGILTVLAIMDDTIHDEDYIINTYDYPLLAVIPDLSTADSNKYGYRQTAKKQ